jgi:uncharacterized protein (TIGR02996 family)
VVRSLRERLKLERLMSEEDALLAAITANVDDDTPRLVYADWLDEHSRHDRAEFIRVQIQQTRLPKTDPRQWELHERQAELLKAHRDEWLPKPWPFGHPSWERGFVKNVPFGHIDNPEEFASLAMVSTVEELEQLWQIDEAEFLYLPILPNLRTLAVDINFGAALGEESIARITSWRTLRKLQFCTGWSVRDGGLPAFVKLPELRELSIRGAQVTDDSLHYLAGMANLEALGLSDTNVWGEGLAVLAELQRLRQLSLSSSRLTDAAISPLIACRGLKSLDLSNFNSDSTSSRVGDRLFAALHQLPELRSLFAVRHDTSDAGFRELGRLGNLEELMVGGTHFGDAELSHLRGAGQLRQLALEFANITAAGFATLRDLPNLRVLVVGNYTQLTAEALKAIASLTQLRWLSLRRAITDEDLAHLAGMPNLEGLQLTYSKVTDAGLARLKEMPQLRALIAQASTITKEAAWDRRGKWAPNLEAVRLDGVEIGPILRTWADY